MTDDLEQREDRGEFSRDTSLSELVRAPDADTRIEPEQLADLSHRMRNAMSLIVGYTEVLIENRPSDDDYLEHALSSIEEASAELVELVGEMETTVEQSRTRQERTQLARRLAERLMEALEPADFIDPLVDSLRGLVDCEHLEIWLGNDQGLTCAGRYPADADLPSSIEDPLATSLFGPIMRTRPTHRVRSGEHEPELDRFHGAESGHDWIACSITHDNEWLGALAVSTPPDARLTRHQLQLLGPVCNQIGIALERIRRFEDVSRQADLDALTQLYNRRRFFELARISISEARAQGETVSLMMVDVDHFKDFNDTYGHQLGDEVLRLVADRCANSLRDTDLCGRYGGEEFIMLNREVGDGTVARLVGERVRRAIADLELRHESKQLSVTASLGCALDEPSLELDDLVRRADRALYAAKQEGRNRVVRYADLDDEQRHA